MSEQNLEKLRQAVKKLPLKSGVYKMFNSKGEIIYVGKAKVLRNRVKSYFDNSPKNLKTRMMASNVDHFEYIITPSEQDAFSLENNLIKENQPKYNILLKDGKAFPYIRINRNEKYPYPTVVRKIKNDGASYYGPYVTGINVGSMMDIIKLAYRVRTCSHNFDKKDKLSRACILGEIGVCSAPCVGAISERDYNLTIDKVEEFLNGKTQNIKNILNDKMNECVEAQNYEDAIKYRNYLFTLEKSEQKVITSLTNTSSFDFFYLCEEDDLKCITYGSVRNGKMVAEKSELIDYISGDEDTINRFILDYYENNLIPKEILISTEISEFVKEYLENISTNKINFVVPKIGGKKQIMDMARKNSAEYIIKSRDYEARRELFTTGALEELARILHIDRQIFRIEGYDISNLQGTNNVASMVVFENGMPTKKEYRKFKIKSFDGANDFESMKEVLKRRFTDKSDKFSKLPDLILIDGGLGQLHSVNAVLNELEINIPVISLAKKEEEVFVTGSNEPIMLSRSSYALRLLQRVRDESHRFAIGFHRSLREKGISFSIEKIDGVGKKRAREITERFASSEELLNATLKDLEDVPGISNQIAKKIYAYLHKS